MQQREAIKLVLWPRPPKQVNGETVYLYAVTGVVITDLPIDWPSDSIVMHETAFGAPLTELLDGLKKYKPPCLWSGADNAMITMSQLTLPELEEFENRCQLCGGRGYIVDHLADHGHRDCDCQVPEPISAGLEVWFDEA